MVIFSLIFWLAPFQCPVISVSLSQYWKWQSLISILSTSNYFKQALYILLLNFNKPEERPSNTFCFFSESTFTYLNTSDVCLSVPNQELHQTLTHNTRLYICFLIISVKHCVLLDGWIYSEHLVKDKIYIKDALNYFLFQDSIINRKQFHQVQKCIYVKVIDHLKWLPVPPQK